MALFFKLWHYLVVQVALDIQGHPWILVFQVVLGYLVNPSPLGIRKVLKEQKKKSSNCYRMAQNAQGAELPLLTKLREKNFLSPIFSSIRHRYLVILDLLEALSDRVYRAEELGHLSCLLRYNDFHFTQASFPSTKPKLYTFLRPETSLIDINSYRRG